MPIHRNFIQIKSLTQSSIQSSPQHQSQSQSSAPISKFPFPSFINFLVSFLSSTQFPPLSFPVPFSPITPSQPLIFNFPPFTLRSFVRSFSSSSNLILPLFFSSPLFSRRLLFLFNTQPLQHQISTSPSYMQEWVELSFCQHRYTALHDN